MKVDILTLILEYNIATFVTSLYFLCMVISEIGDSEKSANAPLLSRYVTQNWSMWLTNTKWQKHREKDKEKVHNWDLLCRTNRKKVISNRMLPKLWMGLGQHFKVCNSKLEMWLTKKNWQKHRGKDKKKVHNWDLLCKSNRKKVISNRMLPKPFAWASHAIPSEWMGPGERLHPPPRCHMDSG